MRSTLQAAWKIVKIAVLIAAIVTLITVVVLTVRGWIGWGPGIIGFGIIGMIAIIVGGIILTAHTETNSWNEGQLAIQKYAMLNAPRADSGAARRPTWTTGPVLEPNPVDWNVRKTADGTHYAVVPLLNGRPVWTAILSENGLPMLWPDSYDGQKAAWDVALDLRGQSTQVVTDHQ